MSTGGYSGTSYTSLLGSGTYTNKFGDTSTGLWYTYKGQKQFMMGNEGNSALNSYLRNLYSSNQAYYNSYDQQTGNYSLNQNGTSIYDANSNDSQYVAPQGTLLGDAGNNNDAQYVAPQASTTPTSSQGTGVEDPFNYVLDASHNGGASGGSSTGPIKGTPYGMPTTQAGSSLDIGALTKIMTGQPLNPQAPALPKQAAYLPGDIGYVQTPTITRKSRKGLLGNISAGETLTNPLVEKPTLLGA